MQVKSRLACTGLRRSEALGLRWCDLDLDRGHLTVNQTLEQTKEHGLRISAPKTASSRRRITLPRMSLSVLQAWRRRQDEEFLRLGRGRDDQRHVFTREDGDWYSPRHVSKLFRDAIRISGVTSISLHGMRHTHVTHWLRDNVNIKVVSARAGHSSVAFTLDTYGHLIEGIEAAAADVVETWFPRVSDE